MDPAEDAAVAAGTGERGASEDEDGIMNNKFGSGDGLEGKGGPGSCSFVGIRGWLCGQAGCAILCCAVLYEVLSSDLRV